MRDTIKNSNYFNGYLEYEYARIEKFEKAINSLIQERGITDRGVQSGLRGIEGFYFNVLKALYSSGAPLESIRILFPKVLHIMKQVWNSDRGYVQMVWMISIGIMLNIRKAEMRELEKMVAQDGVKDYLIDFLLGHFNKEWKGSTPNFKFKIPYQTFDSVINAANKEESLTHLKNYLSKDWYHGHQDTGWYDTHKSKKDIYSGYWSFESGAVAKILGLDDQILKDVPYYPYDMVHLLD
ncbi:PoNe immunity protein domain-containing protein [Psychrobacillus sp. NPDC093180]|uniref:PoNi-like cognate immunity protein n=1 Tax=Psychrobacillus sp. NPDC093180 TaxID=3364489 RepID=UPI00382E78A7